MSANNALGRRKTAVARVYLSAGSGNMTVNGKDAKIYFPTIVLQNSVNKPFEVSNTAGQFDVKVNVDGGGVAGQAEAIRLGISRALVKHNPELKPSLKAEGLMT